MFDMFTAKTRNTKTITSWRMPKTAHSEWVCRIDWDLGVIVYNLRFDEDGPEEHFFVAARRLF